MNDWEKRDFLLLSKGHAAAALYAVLAERGFFEESELATYLQENSSYLGHASHHVKGVEFSTGSLGHAFSVALGIGLTGKNVALGIFFWPGIIVNENQSKKNASSVNDRIAHLNIL